MLPDKSRGHLHCMTDGGQMITLVVSNFVMRKGVKRDVRSDNNRESIDQ
jgi:hypothetical protein